MASAIGKRKRVEPPKTSTPFKKLAFQAPIQRKEGPGTVQAKDHGRAIKSTVTAAPPPIKDAASRKPQDGSVHVQIVAGTYERVLHGICARIPRSVPEAAADDTSTNPLEPDLDPTPPVAFSDTFLFAAHASAVRCLAISAPTDQHSDKRYLATGSSDERINVYSLSTVPPEATAAAHSIPFLYGTPTVENPRNRSLGSLVHHDRAVTCLTFPVRTKLVSAAEDATIAVSRTRDWTVLSSIKAPIPKPQGRPSGDTAAPGEVPAGVSDIAIHPSQRLMLSVGRGERCLRLWNLMTGKKAGVLNFDRHLLAQLGEGKHGTGEGRRVLWDASGEHYVVGFERAAAVFGIDSQPKAIIRPSPPTKIHQMRVLPPRADHHANLLAVSTEDGRILFYDMHSIGTVEAEGDGKLPSCRCIAQLGGRAVGIVGRVKAFEMLPLSGPDHRADGPVLVVTGSSDGAVRIWTMFEGQLYDHATVSRKSTSPANPAPPQVGQLIGTLETGNRITCLGAFLLDGTSGDASLHRVRSNSPEQAEAEASGEDEDSDEP